MYYYICKYGNMKIYIHINTYMLKCYFSAFLSSIGIFISISFFLFISGKFRCILTCSASFLNRVCLTLE